MRLWHYKLIPFLPNSQLIAQWRELNSIFKKQDKHILINYVYEYSKHDLYIYSFMVLKEMTHRNFKIKSVDNFNNYFGLDPLAEIVMKTGETPFVRHHDKRYLRQCFYNLQEKYDRGQKDFSKEQYFSLLEFCRSFDYPNDLNSGGDL